MTLECRRDGNDEDDTLKLKRERKRPPCQGRCPCGNPCIFRSVGAHAEGYYSLSASHYCEVCVGAGLISA